MSSRLRQAQRDLRARLRQQDTLSEIVRASYGEIQPTRVAELLVERVRAWIPVAEWGVTLFEATTPMAVAASTAAGDDESAALVAVGDWIAKHEAAFVSADLATDPRVKQVAAATVIGFPLTAKGKVVGALIGFELRPSARVPAMSAGVLRALEQLVEPVALALDQAMRMQRVQALSVTDDLTSLFNSRYLRESLAREAKRSLRYGRSLSVLFIDLDGFKRVNDEHGHLLGSRTLVEAAAVIQGCARDSDVVARYGGDEFVVALPETGREGAMVVAERVVARLVTHRFLLGDQLDIRLTASIGVATLPGDATSPDDLLHAADLAMYRVKERGKNGICAASELEPARKE